MRRGLHRGDQDFAGQIALEAAKLFRRDDDHFVTPVNCHVLRAFSAGIGHPLVAKETDRLIRLSTGVPSTPPSPAVRNHRIAVRLALETVSALHRIPHSTVRAV